MNAVVDTYIGLLTLGVVLYFVFSRPADTTLILGEASNVGAGFISSLEGRSSGAPLRG